MGPKTHDFHAMKKEKMHQRAFDRMVSKDSSSLSSSTLVLLLEPQKPWYEIDLLENEKFQSSHSLSEQSGDLSWKMLDSTSEIQELRDQGRLLLEQQSQLYLKRPLLSRADMEWYGKVVQGKNGTFKDKLAALTLMISSCPMYHMKELRQLMALMVRGHGLPTHSGPVVEPSQSTLRRETLCQTVESVLDVMLHNILPNRKLKLLEQREFPMLGSRHVMSDKLLLLWYIEDAFKRAYLELLQLLESLSHDPIGTIKSRSLHWLISCLAAKPEQESNILRMIVNKFGDPKDKKEVASKIGWLLISGLLKEHPKMTNVVIEEVWNTAIIGSGSLDVPDLQSRKQRKSKNKKSKRSARGLTSAVSTSSSNQISSSLSSSFSAKYYALLFLSQIQLSHRMPDVANFLVSRYLSFFEKVLSSCSNDVGANESLPQDEKTVQDKSLKRKRRMKFLGTDNKDPQELQLHKLTAVVLMGLHRALPYAQSSPLDLEKEMNILYRMVHRTGNLNVSLQALWLLYRMFDVLRSNELASEVTVGEDLLSHMMKRLTRCIYDVLMDERYDREASSAHLRHFLLLLKRVLLTERTPSSIKMPEHVKKCRNEKLELKAKRRKEIVPLLPLPSAAAFVKRLLQVSGMFIEPAMTISYLELVVEIIKLHPKLLALVGNPDKGDVVVCQAESRYDAEKVDGKSGSAYDLKKRDPEYARAESSSLWELVPFLCHFHPKVVEAAKTIMSMAKEMEDSRRIS